MTMATTTTTTDKTHILPLSYEWTHDNNPRENPRFIEDRLMIFTHIDDQWQLHTSTTTIQTNGVSQTQTRNWIEGRNRREQPSKTRTISGREKGNKWHNFMGTLSPETQKKENWEIYCLLLCRTGLGTVYTLYL